MKAPKLSVSKKTIAKLDDNQLAIIHGGASGTCSCEINVSIIIRTQQK